MITLVKLFDSELKVMNVLWSKGDTSAKIIADVLKESTGWDKTTTYTVIRKCIKKGAIKKINPGFICIPLITEEEVQQYETEEFIRKMYKGRADQLVASLINNSKLSEKDIERIKSLIDKLE